MDIEHPIAIAQPSDLHSLARQSPALPGHVLPILQKLFEGVVQQSGFAVASVVEVFD
jgi:hypothetical protein